MGLHDRFHAFRATLYRQVSFIVLRTSTPSTTTVLVILVDSRKLPTCGTDTRTVLVQYLYTEYMHVQLCTQYMYITVQVQLYSGSAVQLLRHGKTHEQKLKKIRTRTRWISECGRRSTVRRRYDDTTIRRYDDTTIRSFFGEILKIDPFLVNTRDDTLLFW